MEKQKTNAIAMIK
jgi:colicin import membrane protein